MSTVELRNIISQKLNGIEDILLLQQINSLIESQNEEQLYILSDEQKLRIEEALNEYFSGNSLTEEQVALEIEERLGEK